MQKFNHSPVVDQFYGSLIGGRIPGVQPMAALSRDVHTLYQAWAERENLPATPSPGWFNTYLRSRHDVKIARKHHAAGPLILGPHSVIFLAGHVYARYGTEADILGQQIVAFKYQVDRFITSLPKQTAQVHEHVG